MDKVDPNLNDSDGSIDLSDEDQKIIQSREVSNHKVSVSVDSCFGDEEEGEHHDGTNEISKITIPAIIMQFCAQLPNLINIWAAGQIGKTNEVGLGMTIIDAFGIAIFLGLNSALYTFFAQSIGAGNSELTGQYRQKARLILIIVCISLIPLYATSGIILKNLGQLETTSYFILEYVPGTFLMGLFNIDQILLINLDQAFHAMLVQMLVPIMHVFFIFIFVFQLSLDVQGIAIAFFFTNFLGQIIQLLVIHRFKLAEQIMQVKFFDKSNYANMKPYLAIAGPAVGAMLVEFATFDIQVFIVGFLSASAQKDIIIYLNINLQIFSIYFGIQTACSTIVGHYIGKGDAEGAKKVHREILIYSLWIFVPLQIILWFGRDIIYGLFNSEAEVYDKEYFAFYIMNILDFWQVILAGTFRALEKVDLFGRFNFVTYFCIIVPLTYLFIFQIGSHTDQEANGVSTQGFGEIGVWYSFIVGLSFQLFMEVFFLKFRINWQQVATEVKEGLDAAAEEEAIMAESIVEDPKEEEDILKSKSQILQVRNDSVNRKMTLFSVAKLIINTHGLNIRAPLKINKRVSNIPIKQFKFKKQTTCDLRKTEALLDPTDNKIKQNLHKSYTSIGVGKKVVMSPMIANQGSINLLDPKF